VIRPGLVTIRVDGRDVATHPGESVAAALWAAGIRSVRRSAVRAEPRGAFCFMGVCQECVMSIDGKRRPACQEPVRPGMTIETEISG